MKIPNPIKLVLSLLLALSAGRIGSLATTSNIDTWYAGLDKPPYLPPNEVFGPVWIALYILIGISLYLVWTAKPAPNKKHAYWAFGAQLALNALWSLVFFGLHAPWAGVAVIVLLLASIVWNIYAARAHSNVAAYLLLPYLAWVLFATYLTVGVAVVN